MIPLPMFRQRLFYSSCIVVAAQYGSMSIFAYCLPVWFQKILGVGPILSGVYFMATAIPLIFFTLGTGVIGIYHFQMFLLNLIPPKSFLNTYVCS